MMATDEAVDPRADRALGAAVHSGDLDARAGRSRRRHRDVRRPAAERRRARHRRLPGDLAAVLRMAAPGASFEIVSLEVTAGADVAFAHALLRCGTARGTGRRPGQPAAADHRAAQAGRAWVVAHEHHSFPIKG